MEFTQTALPGVILLTPRRFGDDRGWFSETWNARVMKDGGLDVDFVQDNHSMSAEVGTLRGLHYQAPPHAQGKLVRCTAGRIFDVAVDARRDAPTYGQWVGYDLSADDGRQLYIPPGFLHGFVTREPNTEVQYKCTYYYAPESDGSVAWDSTGIDWGLEGDPTLSAKDQDAPRFADWQSPFTLENTK